MNGKVIIVEDDPAISDILKIILEKNGFEVEELAGGQQVMDKTGDWPSIFLLDKQLQDADGLEICRYLKNRQESSSIPVIMVSAMPGLADAAINAGADAFIEKPFTIRKLILTIRSLLLQKYHPS